MQRWKIFFVHGITVKSRYMLRSLHFPHRKFLWLPVFFSVGNRLKWFFECIRLPTAELDQEVETSAAWRYPDSWVIPRFVGFMSRRAAMFLARAAMFGFRCPLPHRAGKHGVLDTEVTTQRSDVACVLRPHSVIQSRTSSSRTPCIVTQGRRVSVTHLLPPQDTNFLIIQRLQTHFPRAEQQLHRPDRQGSSSSLQTGCLF